MAQGVASNIYKVLKNQSEKIIGPHNLKPGRVHQAPYLQSCMSFIASLSAPLTVFESKTKLEYHAIMVSKWQK